MSFKKYKLWQKDDFIKQIAKVAIPMILQQLISSAVNLLDNLMVGQLGEAAISGVAVSNRYFMVGLFALFGVSAASGVYISQFYGAGNYERSKQSFRCSLLFSAVVTLLMALPALLSPQHIAAFFTPDTSINGTVVTYMPIVALAMFPQMISLNIQLGMRSLGETKTPLKISIVTVLTNGFFNYVLIFGALGFPKLGVAGAALGTLIARLVELVLALIALVRGDFAFKTKLSQLFQIPREISRNIFKRGLPLMLNEIGFGTGMAMLFKFYGTRGAGVLASMNILGTTSDLFFVLFAGMVGATTVMVAQPLGANKLELARSNAWRTYKFSLLCALGFASLMFASSFIIPNFYQVSPEVRETAVLFIRVYSALFIVYVANAQCFFVLRAGGATRHILLMDAGYFWFVNIPVVACATYFTNWPIMVIFLIGQGTDVLKMFVSIHLFKKEVWVRNLAIEVETEALIQQE